MNIAWPDLAAALGLLLIVEGILPLLNPGGMRRALAALTALDDRALRLAGAVSLAAGFLVLWFVRA